MTLAALENVPGAAGDLAIFSLANQDHHNQIVLALRRRGIVVPQYALDPVALDDQQNWLRRHQQAHNDFTGALGINANDLSSVDFQNPREIVAWIDLHVQEHIQASLILGVF